MTTTAATTATTMAAHVQEIEVQDPGAGARLGSEARAALGAELRAAGRSGAGCLLVLVRGAAWDHAPELQREQPEQLGQPVVAAAAALTVLLFTTGVPVVVAVEGPVSGFGLALALAADLRVATAAASLAVGPPASAAGLVGGTVWLLERACGRALLTHLAWTGAQLTAEQAHAHGLVSAVDEDPRGLAETLAAVPPAAASALKRDLTSRQRRDLQASLDYESWLPAVARDDR